MCFALTGLPLALVLAMAQPPEPTPQPQPPPATAPANADRPVPAEAEPVQTEPAAQPQEGEPEAPPAAPEIERDPLKRLMKEIEALRDELYATRQQLAEAVLRNAAAQRELDEMKQFLVDHEQYGRDFAQYKAVKDITEKQVKQREIEVARQRRDADRAERDAKVRAARAEKAARDTQAQRTARYGRSGFSPLGMDIYSGKWAFFYETTDTTHSRIDYQPGIGNYVRLYPGKTIDYGHMTISGSIINGSEQVRNIGVAITFFDENGNKVGHETVQINNARPDVPYPFTSKVDMALDRAFDSSSTYVLYADPVEDIENPAPAKTSVGPPPVATTQPSNYRQP